MRLWQTHSLEEITLVRGQGCTVWDEAGKPYLDLLSGTWCNVLGYSHPRWVESVQLQVPKLIHVGAPFPTEEVGEALAKAETGQVVGLACWEERDGAFFGRELFVRPGYLGRGTGTRLQEQVEWRVREAGADAFFISILPHNRRMLAFAYQRGYDTLNTVELRKELAGARPRRGQVTILGLEFKII